jgi:hypothetical protein
MTTLTGNAGYGSHRQEPVGGVGTVSPARGNATEEKGFGNSERGAESVAAISRSGCALCRASLTGRRPQTRFCSATCRRTASALRRGCPRCRGKLVVDPAIGQRMGNAADVVEER